MNPPGWQSRSPKLILASGSSARQELLRQAGLMFTVVVAGLDEAVAKSEAERDDWSSGTLATHLARQKAEAVSVLHPGCLVIGADQVLSSGPIRFDKPRSVVDARGQLALLRGTEQDLYSAVALVLNGRLEWDHLSQSRLTMRRFSDAMLDLYVEAEGEALLSCAGSCRVEGLGQLLFECVDGDRSAILGLPMFPLLAELRRRGLLLG